MALIALAITACLFAWRANTLLHDELARPDAQTFEQRQLTSLLEPVFGANNVRVATHTGTQDARQFLVLVNSQSSALVIDRPAFERVVTILEASAGYNRGTDNLHIQPFAFAPGTAGGLKTIEFYELGALGLVSLMLVFMALSSSKQGRSDDRADALKSDQPAVQLRPTSDILRTPAPPSKPANEDDLGQARDLALGDPKATARIVRRWLAAEGADR